ncbi:MAG: class B sortase [Lachnospiraceae bacterium]|nr:class B sortase [Lachnospiraceae bacterium]
MKWFKFVVPAVSALLVGVAVFMGVQYVKEVNAYNVAQEEYDTILKNATANKKKVVQTYAGESTSDIVYRDPTAVSYNLPDLAIDFRALLETNKDCIGWIYIPSLEISYPVVQSADNDDYVHKTFNGTENLAGCIFSDCRITAPFVQKTILYGHNMKNGSMFHKLFNIETHPDEHRDIWIYLPTGAIYHYKVAEVRRTDLLDKDVYSVAATYDDTLVLSTCIKNETRLVVIATRDWAYV